MLTVAGAEAHEVFRTFTYEPAKAAVGNQPAVPAETAEQFNTESSPNSARREKKRHLRAIRVSHPSTR